MDPRVPELQCIMPLGNISSVLKHGILSHERAARLPHQSVAMQKIQDRRDSVQVPRGLRLHQYANLYFHARNPMMSKRWAEAPGLCVLRVSVRILQLPGVVLADCNASSQYARFLAPSQWSQLHFDDIYALDWRHPGDQIAEYRHKSRKCAEVLVPHGVEPRFLIGAYVVDQSAAKKLVATGFSLPVTVNADMFFH